MIHSADLQQLYSDVFSFEKELQRDRKKASSFSLFKKETLVLNSKQYYLDTALRACRILREQKHKFHLFVAAYWFYCSFTNGITRSKHFYDRIINLPEMHGYCVNNDLLLTPNDCFGNPSYKRKSEPFKPSGEMIDYLPSFGTKLRTNQKNEYKKEAITFETAYSFREVITAAYSSDSVLPTFQHQLFLDTINCMITHQIAFYDDQEHWDRLSERLLVVNQSKLSNAYSYHECWYYGLPEARTKFEAIYLDKDLFEEYRASLKNANNEGARVSLKHSSLLCSAIINQANRIENV